jgi:hypothetical protein
MLILPYIHSGNQRLTGKAVHNPFPESLKIAKSIPRFLRDMTARQKDAIMPPRFTYQVTPRASDAKDER